jgi:hypothetical protein
VQRQIASGLLATLNYIGSGSHRTDIGARYGVAVTPGAGSFRERMIYPYMQVPTSAATYDVKRVDSEYFDETATI